MFFFCSNEESCPSQSGDNCRIEIVENFKKNFLKSSSPEPLGNFQPNLAQSIGFNFLYEGPTPSQRGDNYKIVQMH